MSYLTNCVNSTAEKIDAMMDAAREISYGTFIAAVGRDIVADSFSAYQWGRGKGLKLKDDYAVRYYKAKYDNQPVYVMQHSAIEYIFTAKERTP